MTMILMTTIDFEEAAIRYFAQLCLLSYLRLTNKLMIKAIYNYIYYT